MKIIYSNNLDGKCSAAIIRQMFENAFESFKRSDFISYDYGDLSSYDIDENETVYIVGIVLARSDITNLLDKGCSVVHIDHHKLTTDHFSNNPLDTSEKLITFYKSEMTYDDGQEPMRVSTSVLTWVYCCMNEKERKNPNNVKFDFAENFSHVTINIDDPNKREYMIPMSVRLINDWTTWTKDLSPTDLFHYGFESFTDEETHPFETFWDNTIIMDEFMPIVNIGTNVQRYVKSTNERLLKNSFECDVFGHKALCVNSTTHSSMIFGDKIYDYELVVVFHYDGSVNKWITSFYSSIPELSIDELKIVCNTSQGERIPTCARVIGRVNDIPQVMFTQSTIQRDKF